MDLNPDEYKDVLDRATARSMEWIDSIPDRRVAPSSNVDAMKKVFDHPLQDGPMDPVEVVDELATLAEPGLMAMPSGRFFGWVIGGTLPAALGADVLVSAWDQNAAMRYASPATAAIEEVAGEWLLAVARPARGFGCGLHDRRDHGQLDGTCRCPRVCARPGRLGPQHARVAGRAGRHGSRRRRATRIHRPCPAVSGFRYSNDCCGGHRGTHPSGCAANDPGHGGWSGHPVPAGRQPALGCVRPDA